MNFRAVLFISVILLAVSRKNLITWLCVIIFVSANFAPLKFIGYGRYFPQLWAIFPLATMNFIFTANESHRKSWLRSCHRGVAIVLSLAICGLACLYLARMVAFQGRMMVQERVRQDLIASFPKEKPIKVDAQSRTFTNVQLFKQAGMRLEKTTDGNADTVLMDISLDMQHGAALPCYDTHPEVYEELDRRFPVHPSLKTLFLKIRWLDVFDNLPHVLWDDNVNETVR